MWRTRLYELLTDLRTRRPLDRAAVAGIALGVVLGIAVPVVAPFDPGIRLALRDDGRVVVTDLAAIVPAYEWGMRPGMVAVALNGVELIRLPRAVFPDPNQPNQDGRIRDTPVAEPTPIGVEPAAPTPTDLTHNELAQLIAAPLESVEVVRESDLLNARDLTGQGIEWRYDTFTYAPWIGELRSSISISIAGLFVLIGALWLTIRRWRGGELADLGLPFALAVASPFLLRPLASTGVALLVGGAGLIGPLFWLPLGLTLAERVRAGDERRLLHLTIALAAIGAAAIGLSRVVTAPSAWPDLPFLALSAAIVVAPGLAAGGPGSIRGSTSVDVAGDARRLRWSELATIGVAPAIALFASGSMGTIALVAGALVALYGLSRVTLRPLARIARRATLQRDLVMAATEAERARVAADIHDDALQELTLLVRRLDAAGDTEGADLARGVSDRLRAICGDLRLPVLDDLGIGPALDWLVVRMDKLAGGEVRLERVDGPRPPAEVELAFFRIAQEALSNAVRHGRPPVVVRYRATEGGASLTIDDAGPGIDPGAGERAERAGRYGLLNMGQRAEAIGAILDIRRWPSGGTHVGLEWRTR